MLQPRQAFFAPTAIPQSLPLEWHTPSSLPLDGSAVLNDTPVACQIREPTDPQGDRYPHIPAALAATYPLRCFAPQWARFDNRQRLQRTRSYPRTASAAAAQAVQAIPRTDNVPRRTNSAKPAPPNSHLPSPRQGSFDRRSKRLSFPHFFLRRKKWGRRRPPPRQGETDSPPQRRNSPPPRSIDAKSPAVTATPPVPAA